MSHLLEQWIVPATVILSCVSVAAAAVRLASGSHDSTIDARVARAVLWLVAAGSAGTLVRVFA